jgi:two-component system sensor histidine kinase VicK
MDKAAHRFSSNELLEVLSLSKNATAIYTGQQLIIQSANDAMLAYWGKDSSVIGLPFEAAVPELQGQSFFDLLHEVWRTGQTYEAKDTAATININGQQRTSYYDFTFKAIKKSDGEMHCILNTAEDVTERHISKHALEAGLLREQELHQEVAAANEEVSATNEELADANFELNVRNRQLQESQRRLQQLNDELEQHVTIRTKALADSENSLRNLIMTAHYALMILRGRDWVIEIANQQIATLWGKKLDDITGRKLLDILPELDGQPFPELLTRVYNSGQSYGQEEEVFYLDTPEGPVTKYVSFYYDPMLDDSGATTGIIVACEDITEKVLTRQLLEKSYEEQQVLNEEISATNEELSAANEELMATNEELIITQDSLHETVQDLAESEARFRSMIQQAPVAMCVLNTRDLIIESINERMLRIVGKTAAIIGLPFSIAIPELQNQPYLQLMDDVYTSGIPYYTNEVKAFLEHNGELVPGFFNSIYQPLQDDNGHTSGIMIVATDVTEQVNARHGVQRAEEMLRFSIEAANVGTWYMDVATRTFRPSARLKELFGFYADEEVTYEMVTGQIPDDYHEKIKAAVEIALTQGGTYTMEHPAIGYHDQKTRWLRGQGKLYPDTDGNPAHFSGLVIDITEQKQDEIRKNDFIGMVSHELKTPLTSLSAITQMLQGKAAKGDDKFTADALERANRQVRRMTHMINGFLNVSRLESGKILLNKENFNLDELVNDIAEEIKLTITGYTITFTPCPPVKIYADKDKIGSVVSNLLSNAVKYSLKGTTVDIKCEIVNGFAQVSIRDEGMGIEPHDQKRLFERYYRVESMQSKHISGFGIGLYLSAEIVTRHEGKIWVESEIGKGSTFFFTLPISKQ